MVLHYPSDAAILVAGLPGAGKSTMLARAGVPEGATVLDTDPLRDAWAARVPLPYALWRPLLHLAHYTRAWRALHRPGPVLVAEPGTRRLARRAFARAARRGGHSVHLLAIDATAAEARAGQRDRRRTIGSASLARHARRWATTRERARHEGFATVRLLTRRDAARIEALDFGRHGRERDRDAVQERVA